MGIGTGIHASHVIGREAWRHIVSLLPGEWTYSEATQGDDYGIDAVLAIGRAGVMGPEMPVLQVKGTRAAKPTRGIRIKRGTLKRLSECSSFAAIVLVQTSTCRVWMVPARDDRIGRLLGDERAEVTLRLRPSDECGANFAHWIDVLSHRQWVATHARYRDPLWVRLVGWGPDDAETLAYLRRAAPPGVNLSADPPAQPHQIQASLHRSPRVELRDAARPARALHLCAPAEGTVHAALQLGIGLYDLGLRHHGAEVLAAALPDLRRGSAFSLELQVGLSIAQGDSSAGPQDPDESNSAAEIDIWTLTRWVGGELGAPRALAVVLEAHRRGAEWSAAALTQLHNWDDFPREALPAARGLYAEARAAAAGAGEAAILYMNEAYLLRRHEGAEASLSAMVAAYESHDGYGEYGHFWAEIGSMLYMVGQMDAAAGCYLRAVADPQLHPTQVQLALHVLSATGQWGLVLHILEERSDLDGALTSIYGVMAGHWLTRLTDPTHPTGTGELTLPAFSNPPTVEEIDRASDAVEANICQFATIPPALDMAGRLFHRGGRMEPSFFCFLTAAVIAESSVELWALTLEAWLSLPDSSALRRRDLLEALVSAPSNMVGDEPVQLVLAAQPDRPHDVWPERTLLESLAVRARGRRGDRAQRWTPVALPPRPRSTESAPLGDVDAFIAAAPWLTPADGAAGIGSDSDLG